MKLYDFVQGTPEWLECRAGKITASRCKDARESLKTGKPSQKKISYAAQVAVERIAGRPVDQAFQNWQMKEGRVQEPLARMAYEELTGNLVEEVGAFATDDDSFLYSPDGIVDDDGLVEIKSLFSPDRIIQIVAGDDYSDFEDQCMFGLWLTGRKWIDLIIWAPALEPIGLAMTIKRIDRDDDAIEIMERDLMTFAALVASLETKLREKAAANVLALTPQSTQQEPAMTEPENKPCTHDAEIAAQLEASRQAAAAIEAAKQPEIAQVEGNDILMLAGELVAVPTCKPDTPPALKLGVICTRLGFQVTADFLRSLGFEPAGRDRAAVLYHEADFPRICTALIRHVTEVQQGVPA